MAGGRSIVPPFIARRSVLAAGGLLAAPALVRAEGRNGVALVIGNSKYIWEASLPNVQRDVPDIAKRFEQLGLKTEILQNVGQDAMKQAVDRFARSARGASLAAFYFAGHGALWETASYIVPADVDLGTPSTVKSLQSITAIRASLGGANHRLLVFDCCRNNPADDWRQKWAIEQGSVHPIAPSEARNTLMLMSTAPGRLALDGPPGQNSPFAASLLRHLSRDSVDLAALPANLRRDLLVATEGRQVLWDFNTYTGPFLLEGSSRGGADNAEGHGDPSRIVELPKAYALARKDDLLLPPGLIACRPSAASDNGRKIGSYQFSMRTAPPTAILLVMSVEDPQGIELIFLHRNRNNQKFWRSTRGILAGNKLTFGSAGNLGRYTFDWRDADSGSMTFENLGADAGLNGRITVRSFSRLDG